MPPSKTPLTSVRSLALAGLCAAVALAACDGGGGRVKSPIELKAEARLERTEAARADLQNFYGRAWPAILTSGFYEANPDVLRVSHYAARLWVADRDPTWNEAMRGLREFVKGKTMLLQQPGKTPREATLAYFPDQVQLYRDQYAMIMSEMFIEELNDVPITQFVTGARSDYGGQNLSIHRHNAWTVTLLTTTTPSLARWPSSTGKTYSAFEALTRLIGEPFLPPSRDRFDFYDYRQVYAMAAAVESGYPQYRKSTQYRMKQIFEHGLGVCADSRTKGDAMREVIGRIEVAGCLLAAFYRGGADLFPFAEYEDFVDRAIDSLRRDAEILRTIEDYSGPHNVFVAVPHAIHGLDLAIRRMNADGEPG